MEPNYSKSLIKRDQRGRNVLPVVKRLPGPRLFLEKGPFCLQAIPGWDLMHIQGQFLIFLLGVGEEFGLAFISASESKQQDSFSRK